MPIMTAPAAAKAAWYSTDNLLTLALGLFAFSVVFSVTAVQAALFLALILLLVKKHGEGTLGGLRAQVAGHPLFLPWAVYLGVCLLTSVTAYYPAKGFGQLNSDFLKFVCLFTLLLAVNRRQLPLLAAVYTMAAFMFAVAGITEVARAAVEGWDVLPRANAFMNAVRYGEVMCIALALAIARVLLPGGEVFPRERLFYKISAVTIFAALILSQTRGAYLALFTALATLFCFARGTRPKLLVLAGLMLAAGAAAAVLSPPVRNRLAAMVNTDRAATSYSSPSAAINIRLELWKLALDMFKAHPVLGVGPDNVKKVFTKFHPEPIAYEKTWGSLHNLYLHQAAERGAPGLAALLFLFWALFAFALRLFRRAQTPYTAWALSVLPAFFVMNFTEISFQHVHTSFAVFLALAFAAAAEKEPV